MKMCILKSHKHFGMNSGSYSFGNFFSTSFFFIFLRNTRNLWVFFKIVICRTQKTWPCYGGEFCAHTLLHIKSQKKKIYNWTKNQLYINYKFIWCENLIQTQNKFKLKRKNIFITIVNDKTIRRINCEVQICQTHIKCHMFDFNYRYTLILPPKSCHSKHGNTILYKLEHK